MQNDHVIDAYSHGAPDYDALMDRYWRIDRGLFIASLGLSPGQAVLDAAVGTGLNLPAYPAGVRVTGVDLSEGMAVISSAIVRRRAPSGLNEAPRTLPSWPRSTTISGAPGVPQPTPR